MCTLIRKKFKVEIFHDGKLNYYGSYDDVEEANQVAIQKRKELMPYLFEIEKDIKKESV